MDVNEYRIEQAEKRLDAQAIRFDRIDTAIGELRVSNVRIEASLAHVMGSVAGLRATVIITGIAAVGVVIAVTGYGQTWFGIGISTRDVIRATVAEMQHQASPALKP